jgi:hypothetical protein
MGNARVPVCQIRVSQFGSRFGGVTFLNAAGRRMNAWDNANGYLEKWASEGVGIGQRMVVTVIWEDGRRYERQMVVEPERVIDVAGFVVERLHGEARTHTSDTEQGREAMLLLDCYDWGRPVDNHQALGISPPAAMTQMPDASTSTLGYLLRLTELPG